MTGKKRARHTESSAVHALSGKTTRRRFYDRMNFIKLYNFF